MLVFGLILLFVALVEGFRLWSLNHPPQYKPQHKLKTYSDKEPKWVQDVHNEQQYDFRTGKRADGREDDL